MTLTSECPNCELDDRSVLRRQERLVIMRRTGLAAGAYFNHYTLPSLRLLRLTLAVALASARTGVSARRQSFVDLNPSSVIHCLAHGWSAIPPAGCINPGQQLQAMVCFVGFQVVDFCTAPLQRPAARDYTCSRCIKSARSCRQWSSSNHQARKRITSHVKGDYFAPNRARCQFSASSSIFLQTGILFLNQNER